MSSCYHSFHTSLLWNTYMCTFGHNGSHGDLDPVDPWSKSWQFNVLSNVHVAFASDCRWISGISMYLVDCHVFDYLEYGHYLVIPLSETCKLQSCLFCWFFLHYLLTWSYKSSSIQRRAIPFFHPKNFHPAILSSSMHSPTLAYFHSVIHDAIWHWKYLSLSSFTLAIPSTWSTPLYSPLTGPLAGPS